MLNRVCERWNVVVETARQASEKISLGAIVLAVIRALVIHKDLAYPCLNPVPHTSSGLGVATGKGGLRFCVHNALQGRWSGIV